MKRRSRIAAVVSAAAVAVALAVPASGAAAATQFLTYIKPAPIVGSLSTTAWGAATVGPRDQSNGLEDKTLANWVYWDGGIIKGADGKYHMFASRWPESEGHEAWRYDSYAVSAVSDNLYGPYTDQGLMWPDVDGGHGHNVTPVQLKDGTYAVTISGFSDARVFTSPSLNGPWTAQGQVQVASGPYSSTFNTGGNFRTILGPDGKYHAIVNGFQTAVADNVVGPYTVQNPPLFSSITGSPTDDMEDPLIWYSGGQYHVIFNSWSAKKAYHYTSTDGATNWTLQPGVAYDANVDFTTYTDGTKNHWAKLERPSMYIENGVPTAMTFAVVDVEKNQENGNDGHGSKVIVVPFDGASLNAPALTLPTVYADTDRAGANAALGIGTYTIAQLQAKGIGNDAISSVAVPPGYKVVAYADDNLSGTPWTFTSTNLDLRQTGNNDQISSIRITLDTTAQFEVSSKSSNRAIDIGSASTADGAEALQWEYRATPNQQWSFADAGNGAVKIVNRNSGKVLEVSGASTANGAQIVQSTDAGRASQQWTLTSSGDGALTITNRGSGKVLDVTGASTANGAKIIQWPGTGSANQRWEITKVG
ncbi:endoglucanase [Microbacterium testaceum StLB037]|uniref:Endoglucanase n=1 Tax=Microbacterium testaceum (strain StLB037) TaxID=979556 RepID=E8ND97_MICTS|nr:RICIN domain-containing protein [Microbacterium testaceum]BAJ74955.1 endoglucanase [Microbacterium testaceum StLB037]